MDYHLEALSKAQARISELELAVHRLELNEDSRKSFNKELRRAVAWLGWIALWWAWMIVLYKSTTH